MWWKKNDSATHIYRQLGSMWFASGVIIAFKFFILHSFRQLQEQLQVTKIIVCLQKLDSMQKYVCSPSSKYIFIFNHKASANGGRKICFIWGKNAKPIMLLTYPLSNYCMLSCIWLHLLSFFPVCNPGSFLPHFVKNFMPFRSKKLGQRQ